MVEQKEKAVAKFAESDIESRVKNSLVLPVYVCEDKDSITLFANLPGVGEDDLELQIDRDTLVIYAKPARAEDPNTTTHYIGFPEKDYYRAFTIGDDIDRDRITASMSNGVLTLVLPKTEKAKPKLKKIDIEFS
jgi:HSP20 family molecular chaperone IbpA